MKINNTIHCLHGRFLVTTGLLLATVFSVRANYESTVLNDHPLAYFALNLIIDNSGTATDLSGNGNNSSYYNIYPAPGPTAYITNSASFAGSSVESFVDLSSGANAGILNFGGLITMEAWVQSTNTTQGPADILGKGYDSSLNYDELVLRANDGVNYYGGTYNNINGGASASGGEQTTNWTYLVSTYDGTNWNLYVDGQLVGQGADTVGAINFSDPWAIGTGSADGFSRFYQGNICQVALYTNALTPAQVLNHYYVAEINASPATSVPIIVTQPQSQAGFINGSITFTVSDVSSLATTNQWYKGGSPLAGQTSTSLTLNDLQLTNAGNYSVVVGNANGTTNSAVAVLTVSSGNNLRWNDGGSSGVWDTDNTANWLNLANSEQTVFNTGDAVLFDDTPGNSTSISINTNVSPSVVTVNSSTNNFTFGGSSSLTGPASLIKKGTSTLTIVSPANFTGPVTISGGVVYAGDFSFKNVSSVTVTNNSTMDFGGSTYNTGQPITVSGTGVNGEGAIYNSYDDDPAEELNITLTGDTKFGGSARWDLAAGSQISGAHNLTIDMSADAPDNFYSQWNTLTVGSNLSGIILTNGSGVATNESNLGMSYMDTSCQNPGTVFTVGTNCQMIFYSGGFNGSIHVLNGGTVYIYSADVAFNGSNLVFENGAAWETFYNSGSNPINSAVTLNGVAHFVLGDHQMVYTNVISGSGGFVLDYFNNEMVLTAPDTYSGPTIIGSSGNSPEVVLTGNGSISLSSLIFFGGSTPTVPHIDVSGRSDKTLTLASGQTLGGIGTINGSLIVSSGATLSPSGTNTTIGITTGANATGTIAVTNAVTLNGTTTLKLDGSGVNDEVQAGAGITYGGTLNLVNISGAPLANGNLFQIFSAASYSGSFANIVPATPGAGLAWDTSQLNTGFISVVTAPSQPVINSTKVSGGDLIFSGTNGVANGTYYVLTSTNLTTPLTNWMTLATNTFSATGTFNVTNAINPNIPKQFYLLK
jgi:autotransporter-associated beta strand protein